MYYYATEEDGNFRFKDQMVAIAKTMTKKEVLATARKIFLAPKTPRLIVLTQSSSNKDPVPEAAFTTVDEFKNRNDKKIASTGNSGT